MTTISGTAVSAPDSITFLNLTTRIQATLSGQNYGTDRWSKAQVQSWIKQAIRDYSIRFPTEASTTIATSSGTHEYSLPALFMAMLSVRDHTTDPPTYYTPRSHNTADFWSASEVYAVVEGNQATVAKLWVPNATSTTLTIQYHGEHTWNLDDSDIVTVEPHHHDLLELYAVWQAWVARRETAVTEFAADDIEKEEFDRISGRTYATRLDYFTAVSQALRYQEGRSAIIKWSAEELERIY